jgi:hypothetical protein
VYQSLRYVDLACCVVFALEWGFWLWLAQRRWLYLVSMQSLVDIVTIAPTVASTLVHSDVSCQPAGKSMRYGCLQVRCSCTAVCSVQGAAAANARGISKCMRHTMRMRCLCCCCCLSPEKVEQICLLGWTMMMHCTSGKLTVCPAICHYRVYYFNCTSGTRGIMPRQWSLALSQRV